MNGLKLLKRLWQGLPLSDHARWHLTSRLLEPILPLIEGGVVHAAYLREKEWRARRIRPFYGDPFPVLARQERVDLIFWGVIDWRYRIQRPQHLARGLAERGHRVFYISTTFVNSALPGFELEQLDECGRLYSVRLHLMGRPPVHAAPPAAEALRQLRADLSRLLEWSDSTGVVSIVQHPYWYDLVKAAPGGRFLYDCMDHHEGFGTVGPEVLARETALLQESAWVIATSQGLFDRAARHNANSVLIRNAADYDFFARGPASVFKDARGRRVLGYYGAIADWIDVGLLEKIGREFPDCLILLVGADECGAGNRLAKLPNVLLTGEVCYSALPEYLYAMDVCLMPFRVTPLTLATNPVKIYEYLAAGKPVVSTALPEMAQFGELVATAATHDEFLQGIGAVLAGLGEGSQARQTFAAGNTWAHRVDALARLINS